MDTEDRLRDIAEFWGMTEWACKRCGLVSTHLEIVISERVGNGYKAYCPSCDKFLGKMKQSKKFRIFQNQAVGLQDIEEIETGWLEWSLRAKHSAYLGNPDLQEAVTALIKRRKETPPQIDWTEIEKRNDITLQRSLALSQLGELSEALVRERRDLTIKTTGMAYSDLMNAEARLKAIKKDLRLTERKANKLLEEQEEENKNE